MRRGFTEGSADAAASEPPAMRSAWWCPAPAARQSANTRSSGRSTTCSAIPHWTLGEPHRARRRRRSLHRLRQGRPSSASICCARNCNRRRRPNAERTTTRHRRIGPARRRCAASCLAVALCRRPRWPATLACVIVRPPHAHASSRKSMRAAPPPRRVSSPSSPAPTWRPTMSVRCGLVGDPPARRQADGGTAAMGARARSRAPRRRARRHRHRRNARADDRRRRTRRDRLCGRSRSTDARGAIAADCSATA